MYNCWLCTESTIKCIHKGVQTNTYSQHQECEFVLGFLGHQHRASYTPHVIFSPHYPCVHYRIWHSFWNIALEMVNGSSKIIKKSPQFRKKSFYICLRWFLPLSKTADVHNRRWKQLFQINCDIVNIYQLFLLPKRGSRLTLIQEAGFTVFSDISQMCKNMVGNNNRYMRPKYSYKSHLTDCHSI